MSGARDIAIVIPAYQPDAKLVGLVEALRAEFPHIVVVDDGSAGGRQVFDAIRDQVEALLVHSVNRGKGAAGAGVTGCLPRGSWRGRSP